MASSEVLTARINWNPPSAKIFKTIAILKIYAHTLFFTSLITVILKLFNLTCLNKININMNLEYSNLKLVSCIFTFYEKKAFKNVENFSSIYSIFSRFSLFLSQFPDSKGQTKKEIFVSMSWNSKRLVTSSRNFCFQNFVHKNWLGAKEKIKLFFSWSLLK